MAAAVETAGSGRTGAVRAADKEMTAAVETGAVEAAGSVGTAAIRARLCSEQVRSDRDCGWKKRDLDAGKRD